MDKIIIVIYMQDTFMVIEVIWVFLNIFHIGYHHYGKNFILIIKQKERREKDLPLPQEPPPL